MAIIPAHNEEIGIAQTIDSLRRQTHAPDHILVAADNCTDGTVEIARAMGVEVLETRVNSAKKAGAKKGARRKTAKRGAKKSARKSSR